ncbi:MAG: multicopper oxidase domain-containing protein [Pseudomonadota bacterium]
MIRRSSLLNRRRLLQGAGLGLAGLAVPGAVRAGFVPTPNPADYVLKIDNAEVNPDGEKLMPALLLNGELPGPLLRFTEGELFRVRMENHLKDQPATIHWHGLLVPNAMDGVPGITQVATPAGESFVYEYPLVQSGTYWYHSHYQLQEQQGIHGPMVIEAKAEPLAYDREYVIFLNDWLHSSPYEVVPNIRKGAESGEMQMSDGPDLADVDYPSFLLNGRGPKDYWSGVARPGERVRLRIINGSSSSFFKVKIDNHPLVITHADGPAVRPFEVDWVLMGTAECYDVLLTMKDTSATIQVEALGGGQALGVLHAPGTAPVANRAKPDFSGRQLAYSQLQAPEPTGTSAKPDRVYDLTLNGNMAKYVWSMSNQVWPDADPLICKRGELVEVSMKNETPMVHPMHLHGHFFRLILPGQDPRFAALKHTVIVHPKETVRFVFLADNPGRWFFHCHNLYHLETGMAREWIYQV